MVLNLDILEKILKYRMIYSAEKKLDQYHTYIYFDDNAYVYEANLYIGIVKTKSKNRADLLYKIFKDNCKRKYSGIADDILYFKSCYYQENMERTEKILNKYLHLDIKDMEDLICKITNEKKIKLIKKYYTKDEIVSVVDGLSSDGNLIINKLI